MTSPFIFSSIFFFYHHQVTAGTGCAALPQILEKKLMGLKSVFIRIDFNWIQLICECGCSSEWLACLQVPAGHPQAISDPRHVLIHLTAWQQYYLESRGAAPDVLARARRGPWQMLLRLCSCIWPASEVANLLPIFLPIYQRSTQKELKRGLIT